MIRKDLKRVSAQALNRENLATRWVLSSLKSERKGETHLQEPKTIVGLLNGLNAMGLKYSPNGESVRFSDRKEVKGENN